jgi:phosphate starvation-inducible PhoH-like protein|tara:strand:- start:508 stop:1251 length:744 start_codon:yes stop_codon:yes gene_type:complete
MPRRKKVSKQDAEAQEIADSMIAQKRPKINITAKRFTAKQKEFIETSLSDKTKIMFLSGPAGSTKTYMAVYSALRLMAEDNDLDLMYVRTVIESADKGLGALPGDLEEKFNPYMAPLIDKLDEMLPTRGYAAKKDLMKAERIQAMPINFLRGASWLDKIVIADEAQNFSHKELVTLITRLGENSKLFICGDFMQSDINGKTGFKPMFELFDDEESKRRGIECFSFDQSDIKRSHILKFIIQKLTPEK